MTYVSTIHINLSRCNCDKMVTFPLITRPDENRSFCYLLFLETVLFGHSCLSYEQNVDIFTPAQTFAETTVALIIEIVIYS